MNYRKLGKTGLMVSEIGLGGEWLERHNADEVKAVIDCCEEAGINILDCWMAERTFAPISERCSRADGTAGSFRAISVPRGRMDSMSEPVI